MMVSCCSLHKLFVYRMRQIFRVGLEIASPVFDKVACVDAEFLVILYDGNAVGVAPKFFWQIVNFLWQMFNLSRLTQLRPFINLGPAPVIKTYALVEEKKQTLFTIDAPVCRERTLCRASCRRTWTEHSCLCGRCARDGETPPRRRLGTVSEGGSADGTQSTMSPVRRVVLSPAPTPRRRPSAGRTLAKNMNSWHTCMTYCIFSRPVGNWRHTFVVDIHARLIVYSVGRPDTGDIHTWFTYMHDILYSLSVGRTLATYIHIELNWIELYFGHNNNIQT